MASQNTNESLDIRHVELLNAPIQKVWEAVATSAGIAVSEALCGVRGEIDRTVQPSHIAAHWQGVGAYYLGFHTREGE